MRRIKFFAVATLVALAVGLCACGGDSDDDEPDGGGGNSKATVKITAVNFGNKYSGKYITKVTVVASGVSASEVKAIGVSQGVTSSATGHLSTASKTLSTTRTLDLSCNSTQYLKGIVTTSSGTSYSAVKRVKVPK